MKDTYVNVEIKFRTKKRTESHLQTKVQGNVQSLLSNCQFAMLFIMTKIISHLFNCKDYFYP